MNDISIPENRLSLSDKMRELLLLELSKEGENIDLQLVSEYSDLISELENTTVPDKKTVKNNISKIFDEFENEKKPLRRNLKTLLIAACIAVLILVSGIATMSMRGGSYDILKRFGHQLVDINEGEYFQVGDQRFYKGYKTTEYETVDELSTAINKRVLFPTKLPYENEINCISYGKDPVSNLYEVVLLCGDPRINFTITLDSTKDFTPITENNKKHCINGIEFYYQEISDARTMYWIFHDGNTYACSAPKIEDVYFIIENIRAYTPKTSETEDAK